MASTIRQRLRRFNGTDYDTIHLETHANNVWVGEASTFVNPLNTDQLTLGQHDVYFTAYPSLLWCVDHLDGDYAYLGLYNGSERTTFGSNSTYSGSTIAAKCTTFLNNAIPNVADYLEDVTVEGVTNKVFIPTYYQFSGETGYGDTSGPVFGWPSASGANRIACVSNWSTIGYYFWLSSPYNSNRAWDVHGQNGGGFNYDNLASSLGFRPEVKVRYKDSTSTYDTLDHVLDNMSSQISGDDWIPLVDVSNVSYTKTYDTSVINPFIASWSNYVTAARLRASLEFISYLSLNITSNPNGIAAYVNIFNDDYTTLHGQVGYQSTNMGTYFTRVTRFSVIYDATTGVDFTGNNNDPPATVMIYGMSTNASKVTLYSDKMWSKARITLGNSSGTIVRYYLAYRVVNWL